MIVCHVTEEWYKEGRSLLDRFLTVSPVSETQKLRTFLSVRNDVLSRNVVYPVRVCWLQHDVWLENTAGVWNTLLDLLCVWWL